VRAPRWTLAAAATALVLPTTGPALAAAASDPEVTFVGALGAAISSTDTGECVESDLELEDVDTPATGEVPACEDDHVEDEDEHGDGDGDADGHGDGDDNGGTDGDGIDGVEEHDGEVDADEDAGQRSVDESERITHGHLVSTVARCAPRGPDVETDWGLRNHGAFVSAAATGGTLEVDGESYDLSTMDGADALCERIAEGAPGQETEGEGTADAAEDADGAGPAADARDERRGPPAHAGQGGGGDTAGGPPSHAGGGNAGGGNGPGGGPNR
jgi:hypothetical protein